MSVIYKVDVIKFLKTHGYNTNRIRNERLIGQKTLQSLREGGAISLKVVDKICKLTGCQPGDLLEYVPDEQLSKGWDIGAAPKEDD